MASEITDVYEHALMIMREYPHVTAVGCAWTEVGGLPVALACGATIEGADGRAITPEKLAMVEGDRTDPSSDAWETSALAAIRACSMARSELERLLA